MLNARAILLAIQLVVSGHWPDRNDPEPRSDAITIARGTRIMLMATTEINSDHAVAGTVVRFRVDAPVTIENRLVISVGTPAFGVVTKSAKSGLAGKYGKMEFRFSYVQLGDARIPISGGLIKRGTGGSARTAFATAGVFGIFYRGNSAKIKAGDIVEAQVDEDIAVSLAIRPTQGIGSSPDR